VNHIAQIHADPELHALVFQNGNVASSNFALNGDGRGQGTEDCIESSQHSIACIVDDLPAVGFDDCGNGVQVSGERPMRRIPVLAG